MKIWTTVPVGTARPASSTSRPRKRVPFRSSSTTETRSDSWPVATGTLSACHPGAVACTTNPSTRGNVPVNVPSAPACTIFPSCGSPTLIRRCSLATPSSSPSRGPPKPNPTLTVAKSRVSFSMTRSRPCTCSWRYATTEMGLATCSNSLLARCHPSSSASIRRVPPSSRKSSTSPLSSVAASMTSSPILSRTARPATTSPSNSWTMMLWLTRSEAPGGVGCECGSRGGCTGSMSMSTASARDERA